MELPLLVMGGGLYARELATWVEGMDPYDGFRYRVTAFFQEMLEERTSIDGVPVLDSLAGLPKGMHFALGVADPKLKRRFASMAAVAEFTDAYPITHNTSTALRVRAEMLTSFGPHASIAVGSYLGRGVSILPGATIAPDCHLGDFVTVLPGARVGGGCIVETGAVIGSGACVRQRIKIGAGAVIGMGSVVLRSIPNRGFWAGNPAEPLIERDSDGNDSQPEGKNVVPFPGRSVPGIDDLPS